MTGSHDNKYIMNPNNVSQSTHSLTCSLIHILTHTSNFACCLLSTSWISHGRQCSYTIHSEGLDSHVIYIVQPSSLTQSLMFVCLSLFHFIPIKMLFQTNWTFSVGAANINALHRLLGKTEQNNCFHVTKCQITGRVLIHYIWEPFLIPFLVSSSFYIMSLIVWERRLMFNSHFSLRVSSTDKHSDLVTFFHSFLTTGCNYLMSVPVCPGLTPLLSLSLHVPQYLCLALYLFLCSIHCISWLDCLTDWLTDRPTDPSTKWLADRQTDILPFPFLSRLNCRDNELKITTTFGSMSVCHCQFWGWRCVLPCNTISEK